MAAHDYYNNNNSHSGYGYNSYDNYNNSTAHHHHNPTSPFDDQAYPSYPSSYNNLSHQTTPHDGRDPFEDSNAVPMHNYHAKQSSQSSTAPVVTPEYNDPFVRDAKPARRPRAPSAPQPKGWRRYFTGRVTWVCYFLTLVQIIVFIVEIVKNGQLPSFPLCLHALVLTATSRSYQIAHRDPPPIQSHDWPVALRPHQHGCPLPALHAHHAQRPGPYFDRCFLALS